LESVLVASTPGQRSYPSRLAYSDLDLLHDVLYQDKDYEIAYLSNRSIANLAILRNGSRTSRLLRRGILREGSTG
jgi:hypothetical protein